MKLLIGTALLALALPALASAEDDRHFLFSGDGVAEGTGRVALEVSSLFVVSDGGALPMPGVRYARGLTGPLDLRLSLTTLGVYNDFDAGLGVALVRTPSFGLGARLGVTGIVLVLDTDRGGGVFAATPGLVATVRSRSIALSIGADVPLFFNGFLLYGATAAAGVGFAPTVRPNVAIEVGSGDGAKFYIRGDALIAGLDSDPDVLGHVAVGVHF